MSQAAFAQTIIAKLNSSIGKDGSVWDIGHANIAMTAVAEGITEYLLANTVVTISYSGRIMSAIPYPDPVITDTFKIVGSCAATGPSDSFDSWIKQIESNIISGFQLASLGTAGVSFSQKPFINSGISTTQSVLKSAHDINDKDPQQKIWEIVCGGIMDWINNVAINSTPGYASRSTGPSSGTATITKINIS